MTDPFNLERFVTAQEPVIAQVYQEMRNGRKQTHWMWFIFPQLAGLGRSPMAQHYAVASPAEAQAYLDHPRLGPRLIELTECVNSIPSRTIHDIFGSPDDLKFHSSMTLFAAADRAATPAFRTALEKYFSGQPDPLTVDRLRPP
jgi:uncharacterized protein (DUF1810 family)